MGAGDLLQSLTVTEVAVTIVKPLRETDHLEFINPTVIDCWNLDVYVPTVFAYRIENQPDANAAYTQLVSRMKNSLQKVLTSFYPFAGRWIATSHGYPRQLLCNDAGVPFIEAYADKDLNHFLPPGSVQNLRTVNPGRVSALHAKSFDIVGMDATQYRQKAFGREIPGLFIQVTRFKCGGVVIAPTYSHMLTDGRGFFDFMQAWSDVSLTGVTAIIPDFDRAAADVPAARDIYTTGAPSFAEPTFKPYSKTVFQVKKSFIESMKDDAKVETNGTQYVSKQDCIRAHLWQALLKLPSSITEAEEVEFISLVEGRTKFFDPPLSKYLCGNVWIPMVLFNSGVAQLSASSVALKTREKLMATGQQDWTTRVIGELRETARRPTSVIWINTSWANFPVYEIDFGFAKPFFAYSASLYGKVNGKFVGRSIICPALPGNHESVATLHLDTTPEVIEALCFDSQFMSMFLEN